MPATGAEKLLKIVHGLVAEHEQGQYGLVGQLGKDQPAFDAALTQGNLVLRSSLLLWWELYYRAAQHGVLGPRAKRWLSTGSPPEIDG